MATTEAEDVQVVAEFPVSDKPGADRVRATIQTYRGARWIHLRRWYLAESDGPDDDWRPGKGLAIREGLLGSLKEAVDAVVEAANASAG